MRWLALDVGSTRVGVAVCTDDESVVTPLPPLAFRGAAKLSEDVARLISERGIAAVVVGVPTTRSGEGRGERRVAEVVAALRDLGVGVVTVDERGTTREAERQLLDAGVPRRRWKDVVDGVAARIILEAHLARRDENGRLFDGPVDLSGGGC